MAPSRTLVSTVLGLSEAARFTVDQLPHDGPTQARAVRRCSNMF